MQALKLGSSYALRTRYCLGDVEGVVSLVLWTRLYVPQKDS